MSAVLLLTLLAALSALAWTGGRPDHPDRTARRLVRYLRRDGVSEGPEPIFARADRGLRRLPFGAAFERYAVQAGVAMPVSALLLGAGAGVSVAAGIGAAAGGPVGAVPPVLAAILVGHAALRTARSRRIGRMEAQLPAALDMLVGQLRSHRSVGEGISDIARWIAPPLGGECRRLAEELRIGVPLPRALERLRDRMPARAVPAIVTAIMVADRTGANLAECLARQAAAVRAQIAFRQELSAMTAHARATGMILALLPIVVAAAMFVLDSGVFEPMVATTSGRVLLGTACAMELAGWLTMRWMIHRVEA